MRQKKEDRSWDQAMRQARARLPHGFPKIVCLCGSTRFAREYADVNFRETMAGRIVLSVGAYVHCGPEERGDTVEAAKANKEQLDVLHLRKIDLCDEVFVIDVDGYVGESAKREIEYATKLGKRIRYLSEEDKGLFFLGIASI